MGLATAPSRYVLTPGSPANNRFCVKAVDHVLRPLQSHEDFRACVDLQRHTWGPRFTESVPPAVLKISQKVGGVAAGAFDANGTLLGFVFGVTGWQDGERCHWSHMLAVREEYRDRGIGRALKDYQRTQLLDRDIRVMYWTYDPLVARNAHLNIEKLGVRVIEYVTDMYGDDPHSSTDAIIGTDRFVVAWDLATPSGARHQPTDRAPTESDIIDAPFATRAAPGGERPYTPEVDLTRAPLVKVDIPADIQSLKTVDPTGARQWRQVTRSVFEAYMDRDYRIVGFHDAPAGGGSYLLRAARPLPNQE